jgi:addiction module HigA family antidote
MPMKSKSSTTTDRLDPVHPGEVLEQEFLLPMELSAGRVAADIGVPAPRINDIVLRRRAVTADTALRLAKYFGTSATFWLGLQNDYDLALQSDLLGSAIDDVPRVDLTRPVETRGRRREATPLAAKKKVAALERKVHVRIDRVEQRSSTSLTIRTQDGRKLPAKTAVDRAGAASHLQRGQSNADHRSASAGRYVDQPDAKTSPRTPVKEKK